MPSQILHRTKHRAIILLKQCIACSGETHRGREEMSHYIKLHPHDTEKSRRQTLKYLGWAIKTGRNQSCYI